MRKVLLVLSFFGLIRPTVALALSHLCQDGAVIHVCADACPEESGKATENHSEPLSKNHGKHAASHVCGDTFHMQQTASVEHIARADGRLHQSVSSIMLIKQLQTDIFHPPA